MIIPRSPHNTRQLMAIFAGYERRINKMNPRSRVGKFIDSLKVKIVKKIKPLRYEYHQNLVDHNASNLYVKRRELAKELRRRRGFLKRFEPVIRVTDSTDIRNQLAWRRGLDRRNAWKMKLRGY